MIDHSDHSAAEATSSPIDMAAGRRAFIQAVGLGGTAAVLFGGAKAEAAAATPDLDVAILSFALNLEYLEAEFYLKAAFGVGLPDSDVSGKGTLGGVTGGRKVTFTNPIVSDYAREIAADEHNHVKFLRSALGKEAIAPPCDRHRLRVLGRRAGGRCDPQGREVRPLCGRRELPARRLHLRGRRGHGL